ncbi:unnamed protein product [Anisakis simplex]|uniref:Membrane-associated protein n=1 Tax=Anisakis simplex TaxID=6269 RepID=A0A0M3IY23_ANISI|nr:unnamed protein product [Anisakis simplex]
MKVEYCGGCDGDDQECYDRMNAAAGGCTPAYIRRLDRTQQQPNVICGEVKAAAAAAAAQPPFMTASSSSLCCFEMMHLKTAGMVVAYVELMLLISLLSSLAAQCVVRGYSPALLLTVIVSGIQALCLYSLVIGIKRERLDFLLLSMASIGIRLLLAGVYLIAVVIANYVQPIRNGMINGDSEYADDDHDGSSSLLISDLHNKNIVILCSTVAVVFVVVYGYCEWLIWRLYSYLGAIDECILVGSASSCIMEQSKSATANGLVGKKRSAATGGGHVTSCRWLCWHWFSGRSSSVSADNNACLMQTTQLKLFQWRRECCDHDGHLANARDSCSSTFSLWAIDKNNAYRNCNSNNNDIQYKTTTITLADEEQKRAAAAVEQREFIRRAVLNKEADGDGQMAAMTTSTMITTASPAPAPAPESVQSSPEPKLERSLTIKMASA